MTSYTPSLLHVCTSAGAVHVSTWITVHHTCTHVYTEVSRIGEGRRPHLHLAHTLLHGMTPRQMYNWPWICRLWVIESEVRGQSPREWVGHGLGGRDMDLVPPPHPPNNLNRVTLHSAETTQSRWAAPSWLVLPRTYAPQNGGTRPARGPYMVALPAWVALGLRTPAVLPSVWPCPWQGLSK